jgi:hypothetical protein
MEFNKFIFVTDLHITTSAPFRVGDPLQDIISKLEYVIEQANSYDALILIGGDVFDKSTIPYEAYTAVCEVFKKAKYTPIAIKGNHDQLFRCDDNDKKTTIYNAFKLGVLHELKSPMDAGSCILTPDKSLINREKPQILVYHGFLNVKDGKHTVFVDDLAGVTTPTHASPQCYHPRGKPYRFCQHHLEQVLSLRPYLLPPFQKECRSYHLSLQNVHSTLCSR